MNGGEARVIVRVEDTDVGRLIVIATQPAAASSSNGSAAPTTLIATADPMDVLRLIARLLEAVRDVDPVLLAQYFEEIP
jgi:hypothetical protein